MADAGHTNACLNRIYYACFYAVSALLLLHDLSSSKHTGVRSLFNQYFVRTDKISKSLAEVYNDLFIRRQEGDYVDFVRFDAAQVGPWMEGAEQFVKAIAALIDEPGS